MVSESRRRYRVYKQCLLERFVAYRRARFNGQDHLFDAGPGRPHIFAPEHATRNLFDPCLLRFVRDQGHRWLGDMGSSQALAVSVFGTLINRGDLGRLAEVADESGKPLLPGFDPRGEPIFEHRVSGLHEPRPTQVDLFLWGQEGNVAVECKL